MPDPVEAYFTQLRDIRSSGAGVAEISYYGPLAALFDAVGTHLKPKVRALMQLRNTGSGNPDGGLFTTPQLKGWEPDTDPLFGQLPSRGAIEVKGTGDDVFSIAETEQVARYVDRYGIVLVTNLRDFVLVGRDAAGTGLRTLESCRLSETEAGFWARIATPHKFAEEAGEGLTEFLRRVLLHNAPLTDPRDVAWFLASYARTARLRLERRHELPALDALRSQLEDALGLKFEGEKGDHFFRSTLVQTLFYGMFASWVLWARDREHTQSIDWRDRFQWETATATLHVPMVYELFRQFADVRQLGALGISEVLEWAEEVIWRIDRPAFFEKFREEHAVQYFYEPFLEAFDPQLRKELGVWYTPDEVVRYMVARVDTVLREELGIADGLADPSVVVLDPCCGTGAYLVEVLRKIDETLTAKGADALTRQDVKRAAMTRVIGFEIMPAPFVVAHLQLGILLAELGVPLRDADERAAIYLTNALTGWGDGSAASPKDKHVGEGQPHSTVLFPEFAEERDAADRVKREERILVVIGNPPYNSFAGTVTSVEELTLVTPYKSGLSSRWGVNKSNLDDLYIRFFRLAERTIAERAGRGVVALISNYSYLAQPSFAVMREHMLDSFDRIWLDNMNGDSRATGKLTPDGQPDPSVFSTRHNREGIRVGTAVCVMTRAAGATESPARVDYREFWGAGKLQDLETAASTISYETLSPAPETKFSFRPTEVVGAYISWPSLTQIARKAPITGCKENRGFAMITDERAVLVERMAMYFNPAVSWEEMAAQGTGLTQDVAAFDARAVRDEVLQSGVAWNDAALIRYTLRPLELKYAYLQEGHNLWNRSRPALLKHRSRNNWFLVSRPAGVAASEGLPAIASSELVDFDAIRGHAYHFPVWLSDSDTGGPSLFDSVGGSIAVRVANLSDESRRMVHSIGLPDPDTDAMATEAVWGHVLSILSSPAYLVEHKDMVRRDWPRIPMPSSAAGLAESGRLGHVVAGLVDASAQVDGVTGSDVRAEIAVLGLLSSSTGSVLAGEDLEVTAGWGGLGGRGIVMPSIGKLTERDYTAEERAAIAEGAESLGMSAEQAIALLGETCFDVYLNDVAYWRCVPASVWRYTIGGYQVIKKWLSYRERALLGRDLKPEEARYVTEMVRRIAALVLMQPELDANYKRVKAEVWEWRP